MVNGHVNIDCVRAPSLILCPVLRLQKLGKNAPSFLLHQHDRYGFKQFQKPINYNIIIIHLGLFLLTTIFLFVV